MNLFNNALKHFFEYLLVFLLLLWVVLSQLEVDLGEVHTQALGQIFCKELLHEFSFYAIIFWSSCRFEF
jgi:hypothetical protein